MSGYQEGGGASDDPPNPQETEQVEKALYVHPSPGISCESTVESVVSSWAVSW